MKFTLALLMVVVPLLGVAQTSQKNSIEFKKAKDKYHLISHADFETLDCTATISGTRMRQFFKEFPQFHAQIKVISIPNCYDDPSEKYFVLLHEPSGKFKIPKYISGSYRPPVSAGSR
jgi:hypothetical protein